MAEFPVDVVVNPAKAQAGLKKVERGLSGVEDKASRVGRAITGAFAALAGGLGIASGIQTLVSFERQMAAVGAISQSTGRDFAMLRAEARRLGGTTEFSAVQVGSAMEFLSRAGFSVNETLTATQGVLTLATAGMLDLGTAADIASNVLSGFRLDVEEIARVNDVLAATATSTNTTIQGLGRSFSFIAPVAASLGIEIETTAAALGVLGDAGIQGSRGATGLRAVIRGLVQESGPAQEVLDRLGLTFEQINPQAHGLIRPIELLVERGISFKEALRLVGDEGIAAFEVLASGTGDVRELEEELGYAAGTAEQVANRIRDNLGGSVDTLVSAFKDLQIEIGDQGATSALRGFIDLTTAGLRTITEQGPAIERVIDTITGAIVTVLIPAIVLLTRRMIQLSLSNPITAMLTGIVFLIAQLYTFRREIVDAIQDGVRGAARLIGEFVAFADGAWNGIVRGLEALVKNAFAAVINFGIDAIDALVESYRKLDIALLGLLPDIGPLNLERASGAGETIGDAVASGFLEAYEGRAQEIENSILRSFRLTRTFTRPGRGRHVAAGPLPGPVLDEDPTEILRRGGGAGRGGGADVQEADLPSITFPDIIAGLEERIMLTSNLADERERLTQISRFEHALERDLTAAEREQVDALLQTNQQLEVRYGILDGIIGPQQQLRDELEQINHILAEGVEGLTLTNEQLGELRDRYTEIRIELGEADFLETLQHRLEEVFGAVENLNLHIADTIVESVQRMSRAVGRAFTDIALRGQSAADTVRNLFLAAFEAIIQKIIQAQAEALFLAAINAITGLFGGGGGITGTVFPGAVPGPHLARGGVVFPVQAFPVGGLVFGPGGPTQDQVLARVSPGEYVVNAEATRRNRAELEAINRGGSARDRRPVVINQTVVTPDADSFHESRREIRADLYRAGDRAFRRDR